MERLEVEAFCLAMLSRYPTGAAQATADHLRTLDGPPLPPVLSPPRQGPTPRHTPQAPDPPAASAPPEDPLASDCRYVGFQTEWIASKRDAGLPLGETLAASRRVFPRDMPGPDTIVGALGPLNRSTRDSYTRGHGNTNIARLRVLPVYQCCVA